MVFTAPDDAPQDSAACISPALVEQFGLKNSAKDQLRWWHDNQCMDLRSLEGTEMRIDLSTSTLYLNIPRLGSNTVHPTGTLPPAGTKASPGRCSITTSTAKVTL
ncbi:hypothetical protein JTY93_23425 [Pseudomonas hygromyciniae]|uniref:PapC N-terminal domain-containing protein n=1 Tax=Pseudomonas hygromyciniae TaxID=2812000 RepID=A0ABX7K434_9PSED|nr:hypothetical protein JTY93_23425 [Pseudomonas hygromyciniae]